MIVPPNIEAAKKCISESIALIEKLRASRGRYLASNKTEANVKESNIRDSFCSWLRIIFPDNPWWVEDHIKRGEANSAVSVSGKMKRGFVDNLVGLTAIEYESNLENKAKFNEGYSQLCNYCASLINEGHDKDLVIGILSDTVNWYAYRIKEIDKDIPAGQVGGENLVLEEIESIKLNNADDLNAKRLISFLESYLGRMGSRPLSARIIASDLGLESPFGKKHLYAINKLVEDSFNENLKYSKLIESLWCNFVSYLRDNNSISAFDRNTYADELYVLTLAKLICANVLERCALLSDDVQLEAILNGKYFKAKGLQNLVEYDYFGWLNQSPYVERIIPIAREIQEDLQAYNFSCLPNEDIFGHFMEQLALNTKRILLGQECTPSWLAAHIVKKVFEELPKDATPQLVDMCCGSGAMIVEAIKLAKSRFDMSSIDMGKNRKLLLTRTITGFDIDPLAVMLSKINWVLASIEWLEPLDGTYSISIPIYHADSLFTATPLSHSVKDEEEQPFYKLYIAEKVIELPSFLVTPKYQALFDSLLENGYNVAIATAAQATFELSEDTLQTTINTSYSIAGIKVDAEKHEQIKNFLRDLIVTIDALQRDGRNGIWAFILRNSYRPALVAGQFNGLVSNPPWLALSKIAENPYKLDLQHLAERYGIKPKGPSHLHIELATTFLLQAIDRYLKDDAIIGCILPETVLNGHHHNQFRLGAYKNAEIPISLTINEIWRVKKGTFKNEAIILFGRKNDNSISVDGFPGKVVDENGLKDIQFKIVCSGNRIAWTDNPEIGAGRVTLFEPAPFKEGADIMPRTLLYHEMECRRGTCGEILWYIKPIDKVTSRLSFLVNDAKKFRDFRITSRTISDKFVFDILTSKLLVPFDIQSPVKAILPIKKNNEGCWCPVDDVELAAYGSAKQIFDEILNALGNGKSTRDLFELLDSKRRKLTQQIIGNTGYIVFTGAGGKFVCSAYAPAESFNTQKLIIDQTLYWAIVESEEEAIYLTGLFNSEAVTLIIQDFQPKGAFGERHIHSLAHGITPPYDPTQAVHQEVVMATKKLIKDIEKLKTNDAELKTLLDPNYGSLQLRRKRIRSKISKLPSYKDYEIACKNFYGI
jgi:hypothetical protein